MATNTPKVTVLMSVFNGERWLREAIESILDQTFNNFEFIILDDGSIDSTWKILTEYDDQRIRLVQNRDNQGLTKSLNKGLWLAKGEYIARMDADDVSLAQRLAVQVSYLDNHPKVGLVSTNHYWIDATGTMTGGPDLKGCLSGAQVEWALYWGNPIVHPSVMFRTTAVRSCGGYPAGYQYYAEDYALWFYMLMYTKIVVLDQPLLCLRKHQQNVTRVHLYPHLNEVISVARSALADRLSYEPADRCIRLARQMPIDGPVSSSDFKATINLLLDAFHVLAARYDSEKAHLRDIKQDLARRLLCLVALYGDQNRILSLMVFGRVLSLSPRLMASPVRIKMLLRVLCGKRLSNAVRRAQNWLRLP